MTKQQFIEKHFDIWVNNSEESYDKVHTEVSIRYAIEVIEDIVLASKSPDEILTQIQIKMNELKQLVS